MYKYARSLSLDYHRRLQYPRRNIFQRYGREFSTTGQPRRACWTRFWEMETELAT